uniref:Transient receptor potential cation channel, subfamily V, member 6 n=1 Tax=Astatotilapia calliptera TaxID=8154 RepID=A0AAX7TK09_ASTCA
RRSSCASTNIFERGSLGETALHVAVMNDNLDAAVALMDGAPDLINEPMTSELFQGITPLHIAVVNQNIDLVRHLISRGGDVSTPRVTGLYFRKRIGGLMYCGEHILSFAACAGNMDIISMVIDAGASTRIQDYKGNTVLHILVLQPNKNIACQVIDLIMARDAELDQQVPLDMVPNSRGLTPFKLAAKEGNTVIFQHLVNKRRVVQWSLGPLTSHLYDLSEIDSWADSMSVLEVIVASQQKEARKILEVTPVRQLVSLKWNLFVKSELKYLNCTHVYCCLTHWVSSSLFVVRFLLFLYLLYIGTFTMCCMFRPLKNAPENYTTSDADKTVWVQKTLKESYTTHGDNVRLAGEIISVIGAFVILVLEIPDILRVGAKRYFGQTALGGPFHVILISYACLVVLLCVFRACEVQREAEVMAVCLVLGWCNVMFFARGFEMLGPYVITIQKVRMGFYTIYMTQEVDSLPAYRSYPISLFSQFELSVGLIDLPVDHTIPIPAIVHVLHCTSSLVSHILLLNLCNVVIQVVATTLMLERRLPRCLWPRLGVCGLNYGLKECWYLRVEERNDSMMQKMRRYVNVFSKEDEKETEGDENSDFKGTLKLRLKNKGGWWELVRHSALGLEMEQDEPEEEQSIKYV